MPSEVNTCISFHNHIPLVLTGDEQPMSQSVCHRRYSAIVNHQQYAFGKIGVDLVSNAIGDIVGDTTECLFEISCQTTFVYHYSQQSTPQSPTP